MKIAINTYPLKSGHKNRGIGFYTENLIKSLEKYSDLEIQQFTHLSQLSKDVDVVHYPWFDFFFHTLPINSPFKTMVTIHDVIPLIFNKKYPRGIKGEINFYLQKIALNRSKKIITDSEASKNDISKYLNITKNKIVSIPLAVDEEFKILNNTILFSKKRKYNLPDKFLLYVGDANWVKNLPTLIKAFNKLNKIDAFKDVKLVLVGGVFLKKVDNINHPELESLKLVNNLIKELDLEESIIRPGDLSLEDLISFYNLATIYIQPSLYEGFGFPILEAFSCGAPVVSSNKGSLREVGGDAAIYFDPENVDQLVSILKQVLEDKSLREKLSRLGLGQVEKFSWEKVAKDTIDAYVSALK